ncbi:hypothetical protein [Bdellovibrio svalbardensis]|uniref:Hemerythrin-like domain-containing protein n=1 Tax=Bdellovibrio svalbardensis TaxID=2972972 RepID=A0ABT6DP40_9BACT|nr:hypothetical protein [Bdellovibrio svalbardensis]MDG0816903.1 hypothetical protein [Bdellovibrio svalbardensis]
MILQMIDANEDIFKIIHFVENVHHPREEQQLFPLVAQSPLLRQGGPLCTYFKGIELDLNPLSAARKHLADLYQQGCPHPEDYPDFQWLNSQSPLSMPMNEHQLGHELAAALNFLSSNQESSLYKIFFSKISEEYKKLLKAHIDKEDHCLFVICERILD